MFKSTNIQTLYFKISREIKNFLLSEKSREFLVFLVFFFIAGGFWLLQTLNNDYETELSIPVRLKSVPNNVVITSEPPSELRIKVRDKGTVLLNYMLGKSFYPINLNFSDYRSTNNRVRIYASEFEKKILGQLSASTKLLSVNPDTLEYYYSTGKSKQVPIVLLGRIKPERQYYIADTIYSPDSTLVYAPREILDTITAAYTQWVELNNVSDTLTYRASLANVKGAKFIPNVVDLTFLIDIYTEKTVDVPLTGINFPADKDLRTFPSKVRITFQVGLGRFRQIKADDFVLNVSYEDLLKLGSDKYTVKLKSVPKGVSNVRISPAQVDFLIEQISPNGY